MVLRCSLLGHDYGEPDVEREREERGSEVVVTVQEYEKCSRCGTRHVISENTEVTSLSTDADDASSLEVPPETAAQSGDADAAGEAGGASDSDPAGTDADVIDAEADENAGTAGTADTASTAGTDDAPATAGDPPTDENGDPIIDDGEILDDTVDDDDRGRGEWPETDDVGPPVGAEDDPAAWPDADDVSDDPVDDDAVILEHDSTADIDGTAGVADTAPGDAADDESVADERDVTVSELAGGSVDPADVGAADRETEPTSDPESESESESATGIERANAAPVPAEDTGPSENVPTEYYCPRCEFVAAENRASLRAGDICPECRKGYLGERPRR